MERDEKPLSDEKLEEIASQVAREAANTIGQELVRMNDKFLKRAEADLRKNARVDIKELVQSQMQTEIVRSLRNRVTGITAVIGVALGAAGFIGYDNIRDTLAERVAEELDNEQTRNEVVEALTASMEPITQNLAEAMRRDKDECEALLQDLVEQHEHVLRAATAEFRRTIEVLHQVRHRYSDNDSSSLGD